MEASAFTAALNFTLIMLEVGVLNIIAAHAFCSSFFFSKPGALMDELLYFLTNVMHIYWGSAIISSFLV